MPNLHKFKMAAISSQFAYIIGPENPKNWILVSLPVFRVKESNENNTMVIGHFLVLLICINLHKL